MKHTLTFLSLFVAFIPLLAQNNAGLEPMDIQVCDEVIERVPKFKFLGTQLDECLIFEPHIDYLYRRKTIAELGAIEKARTCLNQDVTLKLHIL